MTSVQEMQWVLRAQVGDREALESLMRGVQPVLRRYLARLVGQDADGRPGSFSSGCSRRRRSRPGAAPC